VGRNRNAPTGRKPEAKQPDSLKRCLNQCPRCGSKIVWIEEILNDQRKYSTNNGFDIVCICGNRTSVFKTERGKFVLG
jgi:hypothetical protein